MHLILLTKGQWCGTLMIFYHVNPNKLLNKISSERLFKTPWRSCDVAAMFRKQTHETKQFAFRRKEDKPLLIAASLRLGEWRAGAPFVEIYFLSHIYHAGMTRYRLNYWNGCTLLLIYSSIYSSISGFGYQSTYTGPILGLYPANERCRYKVTPSLIGWAQT